MPETRDITGTVLTKWEKRGWFWNTFMVRFKLPGGTIAEGHTSAEKFYNLQEGMTVTFTAHKDEDGDWVIPGLRRA